MHRFHLHPSQAGGDVLTLSDADAHHAANVLRLRPGDDATVLDGAGCECVCLVRSVTKREVTLEVRSRRVTPPPACKFTLFQSIPKGSDMDDIVGKATQLGVSRIVPVLAARCEVHLDSEAGARKADKWRHTAIEALKQCGLPWLPRIEEPRPFGAVITLSMNRVVARASRPCEPQHTGGTPVPLPPVGSEAQIAAASHPLPDGSQELHLVASLRPDAAHPRDILEGFHRERGKLPAAVAVWIGPEGDFTPEELAALEHAGVKPVTLGPRVLRCDTAAISCLAVLNSELSWREPARGRE